MNEIEYRFTVRPLTMEEGGGYLIEFPDLPGCLSDGETIGEAIANGAGAKRDWFAAMQEAGRPVSATQEPGVQCHTTPAVAHPSRSST